MSLTLTLSTSFFVRNFSGNLLVKILQNRKLKCRLYKWGVSTTILRPFSGGCSASLGRAFFRSKRELERPRAQQRYLSRGARGATGGGIGGTRREVRTRAWSHVVLVRRDRDLGKPPTHQPGVGCGVAGSRALGRPSQCLLANHALGAFFSARTQSAD